MKLQKVLGATSEIWQIFIQDSSSTTGAGLTGLTNATSGLTAYYHRDTDTTATAISLVTMTVGTFTSSGFKEIDSTNMPGWYQFCPPNAALASGAKSCAFHLKGATNMAPLPIEVQLTASNVDDGVHFGLTCLPNTAVTTNGSLITSGTGTAQLSVSSGQVILQAGTGTGQLDFTSGVVKANATQWLGGTIPAVNVTGVPLVDCKYLLGTIFSTPATAGIMDVNLKNIANAAVSTSSAQLGVNVVNAGATAWASGAITSGVFAAGAVNRAALAADTGLQPARSNTAQAGGATSITLDASASATDNFYKYDYVYLTGGTGVGQYRLITAYVGSTKVATVTPAWTTNPDSSSTFAILPHGIADLETILATAVSSPATAGILDVNIKNINNVSASSVTTVNANQGTTQPLNFTGTAGSALVKSDTVDIAGSAVSATTAQLGVNVVNWNNTVVATPATAGIPDINVKNMNNVAATSITTINANQGTTQPINFTGTAGSALCKSDMVDIAGSAVSTSSAQIGVNVVNAGGTAWASGSITAAVIADAAIDRATYAADTGQQSIRSNTAQAGGATSITLDASASATTDYYKNALIYITGGTGVGQGRFCTAYNGGTKVATVGAWATNPDNTSTFAIIPFDSIPGATAPTAAAVATAVWTDLLSGSDFSTASSIGKLLKDDIDATVSSRMATYTQPTGFLAATFPSGTIANTTNITAGTLTTVTTATNVTTVNGLAANVITAAAIADGAIDNATFAIDTGRRTIRSGTAQAGSSNTIDLDAGSAGNIGLWHGCLIYLTGGTGAGQVRIIINDNLGVRATVAPNWSTNPDNTSTFAILPEGSVNVETILQFASQGAQGYVALTGTQAFNMTGNITGNLSGSVGSVTGAVGSVTAAVSVTGDLSSTMKSSVATAVWQDATAGDFTTTNSIGKSLYNAFTANTSVYTTAALANAPSGSGPTLTQIVNGVWDEAISGHLTSGSTGAKLNSAAAAGDPLGNTVPGSYAGGTAGYVLGQIGSGTVTFAGPVISDEDTFELIQGDTYSIADGRSFNWTFGASPNLTGATVVMRVQSPTVLELTGTMSGLGTSAQLAKFEMTSAQTGALYVKNYAFDIQATLADSSVVTLTQGTFLVRSQVV